MAAAVILRAASRVSVNQDTREMDLPVQVSEMKYKNYRKCYKKSIV